jgi:pimeloyl-ACP methyl ester carboxylesterase
MQTFRTRPPVADTVVSKDGTRIGYRRLGAGPGLVLVHGGMQAAQNLMALGLLLSDEFTVHVPDRRGRGFSGPFGEPYGLQQETEDLCALLEKTGARNVFGLSAGGLIALHTARAETAIDKLAVYEPPFPLRGASSTDWVPRMESELERGDLGSAMATVIKGTADPSVIKALPRWVLARLMGVAIRAEQRKARGDDVPIAALLPTVPYDARVVRAFEGSLESFDDLRTPTLLLSGSKSDHELRAAVEALARVLPHAKLVELSGVGHRAADNRGQPDVVASALGDFFRARRP